MTNERLRLVWAAQLALNAQDGSNLSGVAHSLSEACHVLWTQPDCTGTKWVNEHPIVKLFVFKLLDLSRQEPAEYGKDYEAVERIAKGRPGSSGAPRGVMAY